MDKYEETLQNAKEVATSKDWELLAHKHFEHELDSQLMFVTIRRKDIDIRPYATLLYNDDIKGFANGHYDFESYYEAYKDMLERR